MQKLVNTSFALTPKISLPIGLIITRNIILLNNNRARVETVSR